MQTISICLRHHRQKKNFRVWTFQTHFRPEDSQLLAQSLISCHAVVIHGQQKKSEWPQKKMGPKTSDLGHIQFL
jgi:hypothetical protein